MILSIVLFVLGIAFILSFFLFLKGSDGGSVVFIIPATICLLIAFCRPVERQTYEVSFEFHRLPNRCIIYTPYAEFNSDKFYEIEQWSKAKKALITRQKNLFYSDVDTTLTVE